MKDLKMRYLIEPRDRLYVNGYEFFPFAKIMAKSFSNKHGQKLLNRAKKSRTNAIKIVPKRAVQKTAEATSYLIGNKITDKIQVFQGKNQQKNYQMMKRK